MDIKQLSYFNMIVKEGSISSAARKLYMSQPPLSYQMKQLEEELGVQLFVRGSKNITLTPEGELFYKRSVFICDELLAAKQELRQLKDNNTIKIGVVSSTIDLISKKLAEFKKDHSVVYEIYEGNTYKLIDELENSEIDIAIVREPFHNPGFKAEKLMEDHLVAASKEPLQDYSLESLDKENLIVYRRWLDVINDYFSKHNLSMTYTCLNDDARTCLSLVTNDMGVALVPYSCTVNSDLCIGEIADLESQSNIILLHDTSILKSDYCNQLIDYLSEKGNKNENWNRK